MTEQDKGIVVKSIPADELPQTVDGQPADITLHGHIETRGLEGESDPNWWKQSETEEGHWAEKDKFGNRVLTPQPPYGKAAEWAPQLAEHYREDVDMPVTLGPGARFLAQLQTELGADVVAEMLRNTTTLPGRGADHDKMRPNPKYRKQRQATRNYRNVMNGLIARATK